jgi:uncharacterized membrane protein
MYNPLTCSGWENAAAGWVAGGPCLMARLGVVLLFFIVALVRKWGGEEIGIPFSFIFGLIGSILPYLIVIIIFGSAKFALIVGLIGMVVGGYGGGMFFGDGGDY